MKFGAHMSFNSVGYYSLRFKHKMD